MLLVRARRRFVRGYAFEAKTGGKDKWVQPGPLHAYPIVRCLVGASAHMGYFTRKIRHVFYWKTQITPERGILRGSRTIATHLLGSWLHPCHPLIWPLVGLTSAVVVAKLVLRYLLILAISKVHHNFFISTPCFHSVSTRNWLLPLHPLRCPHVKFAVGTMANCPGGGKASFIRMFFNTQIYRPLKVGGFSPGFAKQAKERVWSNHLKTGTRNGHQLRS